MYLVDKSQMSNNLEECKSPSQTPWAVFIFVKPSSALFIVPNSQWYLFYPVAGQREIGILISSLPGIAHETDKSSFVTLKN